MNCIIPFTKDIKFKTNIGEILSISLEHDYTLNDSDLLGNFIITGEYKTHEVSVNKEKFEYSLPFSVALTNRIDPESLDFNIEDFTYEIIDKNTLKVDIEYSLKAKEIVDNDTLLERVDINEKEVDEFLENYPKEMEEEKEEITSINADLEDSVRKEDENIVLEDINDTQENTESIINNVSSTDNTFVTYHVHILKENETIETVCSIYNVNSNTLGNYNDLTNLNAGDKIIIPDINE